MIVNDRFEWHNSTSEERILSGLEVVGCEMAGFEIVLGAIAGPGLASVLDAVRERVQAVQVDRTEDDRRTNDDGVEPVQALDAATCLMRRQPELSDRSCVIFLHDLRRDDDAAIADQFGKQLSSARPFGLGAGVIGVDENVRIDEDAVVHRTL